MEWLATGEMMSQLAATLGPSSSVEALPCADSGEFGVALPCASAKRLRVLPEVFDDCSSASRRLSLLRTAIIREVNETVFALNFLETGGIVGSESHVKKLFTPYCRLTCTSSSPSCDFRLQATKCHWRGGSSETARESCHRRLFDDF